MRHANNARRAAWSLALVLGCVVCSTPVRAAAPFEDTIAQRTLACTPCHGKEGRAAPDGYYPRIAGKPAGYLLNQLRNFRDGVRHYGLMTSMVDPLSDAYLQEIANYFSALELPYAPPQAPQISSAEMRRGEVLVRQGDAARQLPACTSCHGDLLTGVSPSVPGLLGLPRDYLNGQLGAWKTGQRRAHAPDCMAQVVRRLGDDEVSAITGWLAAQALPADTRPAREAPARAVGPGRMGCGSAPELGPASP